MSWKKFKRKLLADPETRAAYEARKPHFAQYMPHFGEIKPCDQQEEGESCFEGSPSDEK